MANKRIEADLRKRASPTCSAAHARRYADTGVPVMRRAPLFTVLVALLGCAPTGSTEARPPGQTLARSAEQLPAVTVTLSADRAVVRPGEIVELTAAATNTGATRIQLGVQCGPTMDVAITTPDAGERSAIADWFGPSVAFPCILTSDAFAEPGQTRTVRLLWVAPTVGGTYVAAAGLRRGDGLGNLSDPVRLEVR
jgi:hypothetical protein